MIAQDVVNVVTRKFKEKAFDLKVLVEGVRQEDTWWNVPVQPEKEPEDRMRYFRSLAELEQEIQDETDTQVIFWPVEAAPV